MKKHNLNQYSGFTLLELLIALFIFSILSVMLSGGLRLVINALDHTENRAERLRNTQRVLLMIGRNIEQTVNRPILTTQAKEEAAFVGTKNSFTFTHMGVANPDGNQMRGALQRMRYFFSESHLWQEVWPVLDQANQTKTSKRDLLDNVVNAQFEYLDDENKFQNSWPLENKKQALPRAIKLILTFEKWGELTQLYVISAETTKDAVKSQQPE